MSFDFYKRAAIVCRAIPYGKAATYGQICRSCFCIRADMQKLLLENEGVEVHFTSDGWQVDLKKDGWHNTIEEALRFQEIFKTQNI